MSNVTFIPCKVCFDKILNAHWVNYCDQDFMRGISDEEYDRRKTEWHMGRPEGPYDITILSCSILCKSCKYNHRIGVSYDKVLSSMRSALLQAERINEGV